MFAAFPSRLPQRNRPFLTACRKEAKVRFPLTAYRPLPLRRARLLPTALPQAVTTNIPACPLRQAFFLDFCKFQDFKSPPLNPEQ